MYKKVVDHTSFLKKKTNFNFDVIIYNKYYFETMQQRADAKQMFSKNRSDYLKKTNF